MKFDSLKPGMVVYSVTIGRLGTHALRHLAVAILLAQGESIESVARFVRHRNSNVTARVYAHLLPSVQRRAADAMDRALGEGEEGG
jgi:integrase